jgi:hypothetical protein
MNRTVFRVVGWGRAPEDVHTTMFAGRTVYKVVFEYSLVDEYIKIDSPVIVDQMVLNRYKPVGWRSESYRHYLAAKGMKTRYTAHKYFAKGVPESPRPLDPETGKDLVASGHAQGKSNDELRAIGVVVPPPKKAYSAVDFTKLSANAMPNELNDMEGTAPIQFTSLPSEPIPQIEPVAPIQSVNITPDVVEAPLQSASELSMPDEDQVESVISQPIDMTLMDVPVDTNESDMVETTPTASTPGLVNFDNYPSS